MDAKERVRSLGRGMLDALPMVPGIVVFGLVYGVAARAVGLSPLETAGMSAIVHAGSSQFIYSLRQGRQGKGGRGFFGTGCHL